MDPATFTNYGNLADMMISKDVIFDKKCRECVLFPSCYGGCADLKCKPCGMLYSCKGIVRGLSGYSLFIQNKTTKSCQRLIYFPFFTNRLLCF